MRNDFSGAGSSSGSTTQHQQIDTINQTDQIEVILGLVNGPIKGLANGPKSFFVGDTQYQNNDGSYNFSLFDLEVFPGHTPGEVITPALGGFEDYYLNTSPLRYLEGVSFVTTKSDVQQVVLRIRVLSLSRQGTDAQLTPIIGVTNTFNRFLVSTAQFRVGYRTAGQGVYVDPFGGQPFEITAKTSTPEWHEIRFTTPLPGPLDILITCLTPNLPTSPCDVQLDGHYEVTGGVFGLTRSNAVSTLMAPAVPLIRTTDFPNIRADGTYGIDFINVRLSITALYTTNSNGVFPSDIQFLIERKQTSATGWITEFGGPVSINAQITKTNGFDYRFAVEHVQDTFDVRVTRLSPDDPSATRAITWDSLEEIVGGPVRFDGVAVAHLFGTASNQFSSIPDFWGIYDLKLCKIPTNYDPYLRTYTGTWDGTFKEDWTSNPAWCVYDLGMNETYGLKRFWPVFNLDKWDCYNAGVWCDQPVSNGQGGFQPRYTFNGVIADPRGAMEQLRFMAGSFNGGFLGDSNGTTRLVYDHDEPAAAVFTPENVTVAGFSYSYTDTTTRYNDVTVKFNNPLLNYQIDGREHIEPDHVARFGSNPLEVAGVGCTDPHEASRRAAYKVITATTEKEIVSFVTNRQGLMLQPFNVILVCDPVMGNGISGRIKTLDQFRQTITLRDSIFLELGVHYVFRTHGTNPDYPANSTNPFVLVEIPFYAPLQGETFAFELDAPLPNGVFENAQFSLGSSGQTGVPKPYRITKIDEADGDPDNISIEAIEINRAKWTLADNVTNAINLAYSNFPADLPPPTGLNIQTDPVSINGAIVANVSFVWVAPNDARVNGYQVQYRLSGEQAWIDLNTTTRERIDLYNIHDGTYDFQVRSIASSGLKSAWVGMGGVAAGLNLPPDDVQNVSLVVLGDNLYVSWSAVKAVDLSYYWLKFSPLFGDEASWEGAVDLLPQVTNLHATVAAQAGTYFVKAVNVGGFESRHAGFASTITQALTHFEILNIAEDPTFPSNEKFNFYLKDAVLFSSAASNDFATYDWYSPDLGQSLTCRINMSIVLGGELTDVVIADWARLSDVLTLSGVSGGDYRAVLFIQLSQDGLTFVDDWLPFSTGDWKARKFRYRLQLYTNKADVRPFIDKLSVSLKVPARIETGKNVFVPTQGLTVLLNPPFKTNPVFSVTAKNAMTGDYYTITDESVFGFTINYFNSSSTAVGRFIDWQAFGFGGN